MRFAEIYDKSVNLIFALLFFALKNDKIKWIVERLRG